MKNIKDTIDASGRTITKIGNMTWKQVLTFFVVVLIVLGVDRVGGCVLFNVRLMLLLLL